jgi:inosine/xanthosine triphosphatase
VKKIIIASRNPIKINATRLAFEQTFPDKVFQFEGVSISSDISDQPMSSNETLKGAVNRSNNAKLECMNADCWIGIEGGVEKKGKEMQVFAWIYIQSKEMVGKARTATFDLPKKIIELIDSGMELGDADDVIFNRKNSKQKNGAVGILTKDLIDREKYYTHAIIMALIPFNNMDLY